MYNLINTVSLIMNGNTSRRILTVNVGCLQVPFDQDRYIRLLSRCSARTHRDSASFRRNGRACDRRRYLR
jgi:hypothetical protein